MGVGVTDGAGDLHRGLSSLHANGQQKDLGDGIAAAEDADHVVDRRACRGGDDGDAPGIWRQGLFMAFVKQALLPQLFLQLLKGHAQVAGALGRQAGTVQLVRAVAGIDADTAGGDDLHTVFRAEAQARGAAPEHNTLQTALTVLQRKVVMAGGVYLIVGDLAPQQDLLQWRHVIQQVLDKLVDLGHRENILARRGDHSFLYAT